MEFLLKPLNMSFGSMTRLRNVAEYIVSNCNEELDSKPQIRNKVDKPCRRPEYWSLKKDNSVVSDNWNTFPFELVSPVLDYNDTNTWRNDLREIFRVLGTVRNIRTNLTCGVHIHISRGVAPWTLRTLKELSRDIFYFEEVIDNIVPAERVDCHLIRSNRRGNEVFKGMTPHECLRLVERCVTVPQLANLMNGGSRYFAWNMLNMVEKNRKTIEFRQPPGEDNADGVLQWAEFVVLFLHAAAISVPFERLSGYRRTREGLFEFLSIHSLPGSDIEAVRTLLSKPFTSPDAAADAERGTQIYYRHPLP